MSMRLFLCILSTVPLLTLSACGDGWETVPYSGIPYGERTAGTGVQYVRKVMAREHGPILAPEMKKETPAPVSKAPEPASTLDRAFDARLKK
ncbi:MAG: hypothetical protein H6862_04725 [Rhodospirillales bacterium]|nr:hypothetical protein [Rhodospirillales bacterium]